MSLDEAREKAIRTYNAAADRYDAGANAFWSRFGTRTIGRLGLQAGDRVLDVCCGSGASALPAARAVGATGAVIGVDLCTNLLALARAKASRESLRNVEFRTGDLTALNLPEAPFDAVVCVFGIFFVPDMVAAAKALWREVRPDGRLALTTWGPRFFEPCSAVFWEAVRDVRPDLHKNFNPWDRISDPESVMALLREAGIGNADAAAEAAWHPIPSPDAFWDGVLGSGYRGTVDQMSEVHREHVRRACFDFITTSRITEVEANVVYAVARKTPGGPSPIG